MSSGSAIPPGVSSFVFFFEPILYELGRYNWDHVPLVMPPNVVTEDFDAAFELLLDEPYVPSGILLPEFANWIIEDWTHFYGFLDVPENPAEFFRIARREPSLLEKIADIAFLNVDGAYWILYARDESLLNRVAEHVARKPGFYSRTVEHS